MILVVQNTDFILVVVDPGFMNGVTDGRVVRKGFPSPSRGGVQKFEKM